MRPVKPGDPIGKHLTARTFNNLTKRPQNKTYIPPQRDIPNSTMVRVVPYTSSNQQDIYHPVALREPWPRPGFAESGPETPQDPLYTYPTFRAQKPFRYTFGEPPVIAILQDYMTNGTSARAVLRGITWAYVYVNNAQSDFDVGLRLGEDGYYRLEFIRGPGIARVIWRSYDSYVEDGYKLCLIDMYQADIETVAVGYVSQMGTGVGGNPFPIPAMVNNRPGAGRIRLVEYDTDGNLVEVVPARYLSVINTHTFDIPPNSYVTARFSQITNAWIIDHPGIVDLRVDGYRLQYKMSHGDWVTWHIGADCDEENPAGSQYFRTGTTDSYLQPNGTDTYIRP